MTGRIVLLFSFLLLAVSTTLADTERITDFDSHVTVNDDTSLTVREVIRVHSTGKEIRHGIYRKFPVVYAGGWFTTRKVGFEVLEVRRDDRPESYHIKTDGNYRRVYMGKEGVLLAPGDYVFSLTYRTDRQIGFLSDHDELYWNATGNDWDFPIGHVSCTVVLPDNVPRDQLRLEAYTGSKGQKRQDFTSSVTETGEVVFQTTRPFAIGEGLTVVVSWPKGFLHPPDNMATLSDFFRNNTLLAVTAVGLLIVFIYFLVAWWLVGRDPDRGVIIPLFEPPDGLSPPVVRYVRRMTFDDVCFSATLIDAAVKGHLVISQSGNNYSLVQSDSAPRAPLSPEEQAAVNELLDNRSVITLRNSAHTLFEAARNALKRALRVNCNDRFFRTNLAWFVPGLALSVLSVVSGAIAQLLTGETESATAILFLSVWLAFWSVGVYALLRQTFTAWRNLRGPNPAMGTAAAVLSTLFAVPFVAGEVVVLGIIIFLTSLLMIPILLGLVFLNILFHFLLKAPTVEGRALMDHIDGFRMYLATAEADILNTGRPLERTPELFERYLPYAVALGVQNQWAEKFTDVLADAGRDTGTAHGFGWYRGTESGTTRSSVGLASVMAGSFGAALSVACTAPGSSSGGGGGGSSGGGGGGGGGGGW